MNAAPSHQMKIRIVSASRRTDIPAFYGKWFMNRVRAGWCAVPNPFNSKQVSRIEFDPGDTLLVFWTRWAAPFLRATDELTRLGYRFYFQYTLISLGATGRRLRRPRSSPQPRLPFRISKTFFPRMVEYGCQRA